jgi:hypothetical protein
VAAVRAIMYGGRFDGLEVDVRSDSNTVLVPVNDPFTVADLKPGDEFRISETPAVAYIRSRHEHHGCTVFILMQEWNGSA